MFTFNATFKSLALASLIAATPCLAKNEKIEIGTVNPTPSTSTAADQVAADLSNEAPAASIKNEKKSEGQVDRTRHYGDVNVDGFINVADIIQVMSNWGACTGQEACLYSDIAPPGGDNLVNADDLLVVLMNWGM